MWLLDEKPARYLEDIVVHELVHLIERQHNERFLALMDRHLPHWREIKAELNAAPLGQDTWDH